MTRLVSCLLTLVALPALAQDVPAEAPAPADGDEVMSFDTLLITTFQGEPQELQPQADEFHTLLVESLQDVTELYYMNEVPSFNDALGQPTTGRLYMQSCPPGQYSGCALVVSERVNPDWTIGATVSKTSEEALLIDVVFLDNRSQREVLSFGMDIEEGQEQAFLEGVAVVYQKLQEGAFENIDLRNLEDDGVARELEKAQKDLLASSLAEVEAELGELQTYELQEVQKDKLTRKQLNELQETEGASPWEQLGMRRNEYKRYANIGIDIDTWRLRRQGRFGQLIIRAGGGAGGGPNDYHFDARWAIDGTPNGGLSRLQLQQYQEMRQGGFFGYNLELGFGVAPWFEITGHYGSRLSTFTYVLHQENTADVVVIESPTQRQDLATAEYGARVTFVPMTTYGIRPSLTAGINVFTGKSYELVVAAPDFIQPMNRMTLTYFQVAPGAELAASDTINISLRSFFDLPIAGTWGDSYEDGFPGTLRLPGAPEDYRGIGWHLHAGIVVRVGPFFRVNGKKTIGGGEFGDEGDL